MWLQDHKVWIVLGSYARVLPLLDPAPTMSPQSHDAQGSKLTENGMLEDELENS